MQDLMRYEKPRRNAPCARADAHARLRDATRVAHARAEAVPVLSSLLSGEIDALRYGATLAALAALFARWEWAHGQFLAHEVVSAGWRYASRHASLAADLADLGDARRTDIANAGFDDADDAERWGMLYVVEGAALGGRILAESARRAMPGCTATRYLDIGETRERSWRDFCAVLDRALTGDAALATAIRGAERMFAAYETVLRAV